MGILLLVCIFSSGIDFTAGPPVPTGEFPGGPATFVMRGPVDLLIFGIFLKFRLENL